MKRYHFILWAFICVGFGCEPSCEYVGDDQDSELINVWYGYNQHFGHLGRPQRWINVLGNVTRPGEVDHLTFQLNDHKAKRLSLGSDQHRLASPGDFNVEIGWDEVAVGRNELVIFAHQVDGRIVSDTVTIQVHEGKGRLPYIIDFAKVDHIQDAVQVVDGKWHLEEDGLRTTAPYYDRVLAIGDTTWVNYSSTIRLTIHGFTPPKPGPPTYNVTHFGVAMRWRGHHAQVESSVAAYVKRLVRGMEQPNRKWYPLGAQGEFLIKNTLDSCRWRILFDGDFKTKPALYAEKTNKLAIDRPIWIKTEVITLPDGRVRYRYKQWPDDKSEPDQWDVEGFELADYPSGSLCLVPHHTDVTIHEVTVEPLDLNHYVAF